MMFLASNGFPVRYGHGIASGFGEQLGRTVVVADPDVWSWFANSFGGSPITVIDQYDLDPDHLDQLAQSIPGDVSIVGVGGGVAMDVAKWIHWRRSIPLVQIPTLPSVNACFTRMTALRDSGRVRYQGDAVPDVVLVDYQIFQDAPRELIRAGIGDVLSCHTALWDWRLGVLFGHTIGWDDPSAGASMRYVDGLRSSAMEIRDATDDGIKSLMEMHREIGWRCHELQHARFEEGSEHFFAYCFEEVTGRTILHGELVTLGVLIMSAVQGNSPHLPQEIVATVGTRHTPSQLNITWAEIEATIDRLAEFTIAGDYWYSVINENFDADLAKESAHAALNF